MITLQKNYSACRTFRMYACVLLFFGMPFLLLAYNPHGGFEKISGNAIIFVNQVPISPLALEEVNMNLVFKDRSFKVLENLPVSVQLVNTAYGDQSKDIFLLSQNLVTDANGSLDFHYAFPSEGYYDVEFSFADPVTHAADETDVLIQVRSASVPASQDSLKNTNIWLAEYIPGAVIFCALVTMVLWRSRFKGRKGS
jgi:hypothetical protein